MHWTSTLISETGQMALDLFWFPTIIWSIVAALAYWGLRAVPDSKPIYHYNLRVAMLGSLPAGIAATGLFAVISELVTSTTTTGQVSNAVIAVQNPLPVVVAGSNPAPAINWSDPYMWIGLTTVLILSIGMGRLIQLGWKYFIIRSFDRMLDTEWPEDYSLDSQRIKIACSDHAEVPFTFGWRRPVIVIPSALKSKPEQLRMAIRHELVHIKRGDFLVNSLVNVLSSIFWFHPLVQLISEEVEEYREFSCDAEVLRDQSISRKKYAELLLELAPKKETYPRQLVTMSVKESTLQKRIQTMKSTTQRDQPSIKSLLVSLALLLTISGLIACSDLQTTGTGISNTDIQQAQTQLGNAPMNDKPLLVFQEDKNLDGTPENKEIMPDGALSKVHPKHIKGMEVLKGTEAARQYGDKGKNGVVIITFFDKEKAMSDTAGTATASQRNTAFSTPDTTEQNEFFISVDQMPKLKEGLRPMQQCIRYPEEARKAGIQGRVIVRFIVNKQGEVNEPEVIRGIGGGADEEAIRCVQQLAFEPGMQQGEHVRVQYALPIAFSLDNMDKPKPVANETISRTDTANLGPSLHVIGYGGNQPDPNIAVGVADSVDLTQPINN